MSAYALPVLYALFVWWFSTGIVLILVRLPQRTHAWSMAAATVVLAFALYGLARGADDTSVSGAYVAFTLSIMVWVWPELTFLTGFVTGPQRVACPQGCVGFWRFWYATGTVIYHELALVAVGAAILTATWGGANEVGGWTFALLWLLRLSAKLNLFLGVRVPDDGVLPAHLGYLKTFFADRAINALFPISVSAATVLVFLLAQKASAADAGAFEVTAFTLLAALGALGVIEHWFMVLPIPFAALWTWLVRRREDVRASESDDDSARRVVVLPRATDPRGHDRGSHLIGKRFRDSRIGAPSGADAAVTPVTFLSDISSPATSSFHRRRP